MIELRQLNNTYNLKGGIMNIQTRIDEAVARHQVLYGSMPEKAVVPEKDFTELFPFKVFNGGSFVSISVNGSQFALPVEAGKVTDVMLFRKRVE